MAALPPLPSRPRDAHKGTFGRVLIVGGSRGMAGAPCLAARAALRSGAGLVKVAVPESIWDIVAAKLDECTTAGLKETKQGTISTRALKQLEALAAEADAVVFGPGLSTLPDAPRVAQQVVQTVRKTLLIDADGLNAFAGSQAKKLKQSQAALRNRPLVLTPHPGEAARLLGTTTAAIQKDRRAAVSALANLAGPYSVIVLKGAGTLVTDGTRIYVNKTGNPGMATGGTGDVLSGLIGALIGQRMNAFDAAMLGVYLHGVAGDMAAARLGEWSLIAGDLLEVLPKAFLRHAKR